MKTLIGELEPLAGEIRYGQGLEIGYFAQHQLNDLRDDESPLQHLTRIAPPNMRELDLRNFLGKFRFPEIRLLHRSVPCPAEKKPASP